MAEAEYWRFTVARDCQKKNTSENHSECRLITGSAARPAPLTADDAAAPSPRLMRPAHRLPLFPSTSNRIRSLARHIVVASAAAASSSSSSSMTTAAAAAAVLAARLLLPTAGNA